MCHRETINRRRKPTALPWVPIAARLALLLLISGCATIVPKPSDTFPDLHAFNLEGKLPDNLNGRVILVDFWASWCGPCKASFPAMDELNRRYADQGLSIIAVSVDDNREDMQQFLAQQKVSFTTVRDARQSLAAAADVSTMPTSFLIGRDGKVRYTHSGFRGDETVKQYRAEIETLLKEPAGEHAK
jgi:cytochrome c biogenesis protein CcmG/thiol:disulfide interchange protein DsbE